MFFHGMLFSVLSKVLELFYKLHYTTTHYRTITTRIVYNKGFKPLSTVAQVLVLFGVQTFRFGRD